MKKLVFALPPKAFESISSIGPPTARRPPPKKRDIQSQFISEIRASVVRDIRFEEFKVRSMGRKQFKTEVKFVLEEEKVFPKGFKTHSSGVYKLHLVEIDHQMRIWRLD